MQCFYPAIIEQEGGSFGVTFPDLPGCVTAGDSVEEAYANAIEAVTGHLEVMAEHGDPIPAPSALTAVRPAADIDHVATVLVPVTMPGRSVRANITIDENLLAQIDQVASNRSAFIADAVRRELRLRRRQHRRPAY